jgi:hypothetical protein
MLHTGGPAFPAMHYDLADNEHGLTMRDYFAAKAMPSLLRTASGTVGINRYEYRVAQTAYAIADAMLEAREKK